MAEEEKKANWKGPKIFLGVMAAILLGPIVIVTIIAATSTNIEKEKKECFRECMLTVAMHQSNAAPLANRCKRLCEEKWGD